jgi:hypothetical protein
MTWVYIRGVGFCSKKISLDEHSCGETWSFLFEPHCIKGRVHSVGRQDSLRGKGTIIEGIQFDMLNLETEFLPRWYPFNLICTAKA